MNKHLVYLFDPLCGWCYGAGGPLPTLLEATGLSLHMVPAGLFSGDGARGMDDAFAHYAWSNDQRIARLTGQVFSERYRLQVLGDHARPFDSGPATVALTAVHLTSPEHEFDALKAIQKARYVDGHDVTRLEALARVLERAGLALAARRLAQPDDALMAANQARIMRGQALLAQAGAQGVPTLLLEDGGDSPRVLPASALFSNPEALARELLNPA